MLSDRTIVGSVYDDCAVDNVAKLKDVSVPAISFGISFPNGYGKPTIAP